MHMFEPMYMGYLYSHMSKIILEAPMMTYLEAGRGLNCVLSLHLNPLFVYASSEDAVESVLLPWLA